MDRYLYITSDQSDSYFADNKVYTFKIHLDSPMFLSGFWKVGLAEFHARQGKVKLNADETSLYIFTNICKESIVDGTEQPLLRRVEKNTKNGWSYFLNPVFYLPVKRKELLEFEVYIRSGKGTSASFLQSPAHLTLHFKQYPFYTDIGMI